MRALTLSDAAFVAGLKPSSPGLFVAAGASSIITSSDGGDWSVKLSGLALGVPVSCYGGGKWVVLGQGIAYATEDGVSWFRGSYPGGQIVGAAFGNGVYLAITALGMVVRCTDGLSWTLVTQLEYSKYYAISFNGARFLVAAGWEDYDEESTNTTYGVDFITSTSGSTWSFATTSVSSYSDIDIGAMLHVGEETIVVGYNVTGRIPDSGIGASYIVNGVSAQVYALAYGAGRYLTVGVDKMITSLNGKDWSLAATLGSLWRGLAFGKGRFVRVGGTGTATTAKIATSADGAGWVERTPPNTDNWHTVSFGDQV